MQQPHSHHWLSSLMTGLCVVGGFGLGILWHEHRMDTGIEPAALMSAMNDCTDEGNYVLCSAEGTNDDEDKSEKKKTRPRVMVMPHGLSDGDMKRIEEALKRAQKALEKEGAEVPEDFRKHMENFRKELHAQQKLWQEQYKNLDFQKWEDLKGLEGLEGLKDLPKQFHQGHHFRFPNMAPGSGVAIILNRTDDGFTIERREGSQSIKVTGVAGTADSITIRDGEKEKNYTSIKDVPAALRERVQELVEMGTTGRVQLKSKPGSTLPKKESKRETPESTREIY